MSAQALLNTPNVTFVDNIVTPTIQTNTINSSNTLSLNSAQAIDLNSVDPIVLTAPNVEVSTLLVTPTIETDAINSNNGLNLASAQGLNLNAINPIILNSNGSEIAVSQQQGPITQLEALNNQFNIVAPEVLEIIAGNFISLQSPANISLDGVTATAPAVALSTNNTQIATTASVLSLLGTYIQFGSTPTSGGSTTTIVYPVPYATAPVVVISGQTVPNDIVTLGTVSNSFIVVQQSIVGNGVIEWNAIGGNPIIP